MLPASELFRNTHPQFARRGLPGAADPLPAIPELGDRGRSRLSRFFTKFDRQLADNPLSPASVSPSPMRRRWRGWISPAGRM
jgi:hypothetical protein